MTPSKTRSTVKAMEIFKIVIHELLVLPFSLLPILFVLISCRPPERIVQVVPQPVEIVHYVEVPTATFDLPKLSWPIEDHIVTSGYGKRSDLKKTQTGGGDSLHDGIDIIPADRTKIHAPIHAAMDGVVFATFGPRHQHKVYGICVVIKSDTGAKWADGTPVFIYHRYAHLSELWVGRGDSVTRGQVVGLMGKTGDSEGYHLHFEAGFDPMDFLEGEEK